MLASTDQCITCTVSSDFKQLVISVVYGSNDGMDKRNLLNHLCSLSCSMSQKPWLIVGDFNVIMNLMESSSYNGNQVLNFDAREFNECIQQLAVFDHTYNGPLFTWSNRQGDGFVAKKLDRALINARWLFSFPYSKVEFLLPRASNHCLVVI